MTAKRAPNKSSEKERQKCNLNSVNKQIRAFFVACDNEEEITVYGRGESRENGLNEFELEL